MELLCQLVNIYVLVIMARIVVSWFPVSPDSPLASVFNVLYAVTEPVLGPIRRVLPPMGMGGMGLDLSPIIVFLVIRLVLAPALCR